jgi:hypothetical protein
MSCAELKIWKQKNVVKKNAQKGNDLLISLVVDRTKGKINLDVCPRFYRLTTQTANKSLTLNNR